LHIVFDFWIRLRARTLRSLRLHGAIDQACLSYGYALYDLLCYHYDLKSLEYRSGINIRYS